jgi:hypothetical protein
MNLTAGEIPCDEGEFHDKKHEEVVNYVLD